MIDKHRQKILLEIVKSWKITGKPEYRGFRCGGCQQFLDTKAWHYFLHSGGYISPLHFCDECKEKLENNEFRVTSPASHNKIHPHYPLSTISMFEKIVKNWDLHQKPLKKEFQCDNCGASLVHQNKAQGYHVWWRRKDKTLVELHFDRKCGDKLL